MKSATVFSVIGISRDRPPLGVPTCPRQLVRLTIKRPATKSTAPFKGEKLAHESQGPRMPGPWRINNTSGAIANGVFYVMGGFYGAMASLSYSINRPGVPLRTPPICGAQATSDIRGTMSASAKANSASRSKVVPNCSVPVGDTPTMAFKAMKLGSFFLISTVTRTVTADRRKFPKLQESLFAEFDPQLRYFAAKRGPQKRRVHADDVAFG